ncbi:MAG TPA: response regulator transcription factor [Novosphingobium sp.]|nr:response regulator transcription factor [Novosphingobium sp.]HZV08667.1 response regulator transcription factor [Novosphingobium sp.]
MILLVEDDVAIGRSLAQGLAARGFAVRWLRQAAQAAGALDTGEVAVAVLDLGLPDGDGLALCRQWRAAGHRLPVLMLTARAALDDRLEGFAAGADDYLPKPFAFAELAARVEVLARRAAQLPAAPVLWGPFAFDSAAGQVLRDGAPLAFEPKALALLLRLAQARGGVVARDALIDAGWGEMAAVGGNTLDVAISALRRRLADVAPELAVKAVKGQGYQLDLIP